jgi:hypothetical protein
MKLKSLAAVGVAMSSLSLAGCFWGESVQVPPAHVGKILTKDGWQPGLISPSQFRLPYCWAYCPKLIVAEAGDVPVRESFRGKSALYMPKSELEMPFDVRGTLAIRNDEAALQAVFERVPAASTVGSIVEYDAHGMISQERLYATYAQPILRDAIRAVVTEYSIEEISSSRNAVNAKITEALNAAFKGTPFILRRVGLADVKFPEVITRQKEASAARRIAIEQAEAKKQIRLVELQADLEAARAQRQVKREQAQAAKEQAMIYASFMTPEYERYRKFEVLEAMAKNNNAMIVPFEALTSMGANVMTFQEVNRRRASTR